MFCKLVNVHLTTEKENSPKTGGACSLVTTKLSGFVELRASCFRGTLLQPAPDDYKSVKAWNYVIDSGGKISQQLRNLASDLGELETNIVPLTEEILHPDEWLIDFYPKFTAWNRLSPWMVSNSSVLVIPSHSQVLGRRLRSYSSFQGSFGQCCYAQHNSKFC